MQIQIKLTDISDKIKRHLDTIFLQLEPFLAKNTSKLDPETLLDIKKIHDGASQLREILDRHFEKQALSKISQDPDLHLYLSTARHDLRNPVNVIKGYTEMVIEDFLNDQKTELSDDLIKIYPALQQILTLIDALKADTSVIITLPKAEIAIKKESKTESSAFSRIACETPEFLAYREQFTFLIVDDQPENCFLLERYLKQLGFVHIKSVSSGSEALNVKNDYKLILLDITMPEMTGIEVLKALRDDIFNRRMTVLMISGADSMDNIIECIKLGAEDFLPKPFNAELLQARISASVERMWFMDQQGSYYDKLEIERGHYEKLLSSTFPKIILPELITTGKILPFTQDNVAVIFIKVDQFSSYSDALSVDTVMKYLQELVKCTEKNSEKYKIQKIKTVGDVFVGVSGLMAQIDNPVENMVNFSLELLKEFAKLSSLTDDRWKLRVGISYGTVKGGMIGHEQYLFDLWGDPIRKAYYMSKIASPDEIYLTPEAWAMIQDKSAPSAVKKSPLKNKDPLSYVLFKKWKKN